MKQTETTRDGGGKPIVVLTPDEGMVIVNREYMVYKSEGGERPPLLLAKEVCLAVTDTADRYAEVSTATADEWQQEYDEAMQAAQEMMQDMPTDIEDITDDTADSGGSTSGSSTSGDSGTSSGTSDSGNGGFQG